MLFSVRVAFLVWLVAAVAAGYVIGNPILGFVVTFPVFYLIARKVRKGNF